MHFYSLLVLVFATFSGLQCNTAGNERIIPVHCYTNWNCSEEASALDFLNCPTDCQRIRITTTTTAKPVENVTGTETASTEIPTVPTPSTVASSPPSTVGIVIAEEESELDAQLKEWYNKRLETNKFAVDTCKEFYKFDDCKHLTTDSYAGYSHAYIHEYIFNNTMTLNDEEYEYYRVAPWELGEPPMFSEMAKIDDEIWYRRPKWAKHLHVKATDYPEKFPTDWIWFEDSKEHNDD